VLPPVGSADTTAFPYPSTATHIDGDEHDTDSAPADDTCASVHTCDVAVGLVDVMTPPPPSAATHSDTDGHEIDVSGPTLPAAGC
jgi:hypothetical protein